MAKDFAAELKKNREERLNANKKKEKKEKKKGMLNAVNACITYNYIEFC